MEKPETLADFYKNKFNWMPENLKNELGHFNVFTLAPFVGDKAQPIPYKRRDFFKISLAKGNSNVYFADQVVEVKKQALCFSNPQIPYKWDHLEEYRAGYFCIFNTHFFHQFGNLNQYTVFQPNGTPIFELTDEQLAKVEPIFVKMLDEINADYVFKYDLLRNLVYELLHFAMKLEPKARINVHSINASERIATLFLELLERQFPIDDAHQSMQIGTASEFANQLNVHVNHLNRAIKAVTHKTTSQLIAERKVQEAKILLKHSLWNISEIGYSLGFQEGTHFNSFFKKHVGISPSQFRTQ